MGGVVVKFVSPRHDAVPAVEGGMLRYLVGSESMHSALLLVQTREWQRIETLLGMRPYMPFR
jgi:hypothetical protein